MDPELLSDQQKRIEVMERSSMNEQNVQADIRFFFREVDVENIGVVTRDEFLKIVGNLGLRLSGKEKDELLRRADPDHTGTVEFAKYEEIVR